VFIKSKDLKGGDCGILQHSPGETEETNDKTQNNLQHLRNANLVLFE
jgi:hypothetical protein